MIQSRICCSFKTHCNHVTREPISFLHLPQDIRDRIYSEAGVIAEGTLRLIGSSIPPGLEDAILWAEKHLSTIPFCIRGSNGCPLFCTLEEGLDDEGWSLVDDLNVCNHELSGDLARFLCSHNEVLICCEDYTDLSVLFDLSTAVMKTLRNLTIHLSLQSCQTAPLERESYCCHRSGKCCRWETNPLKSTSRKFQPLIAVWPKFVAHLSAAADLTRLKLSIMSDCEDLTTARSIVSPLTEMGVRPVALRLGSVPDKNLQVFARECVQHYGHLTDTSGILDLPTELRQHILRFTDLVTPCRRVYCWTGDKFPYALRQDDRPSGCISQEFCSLQHAVEPQCDCWAPPGSIFLICKELLPDARAIFFSYNRFVIRPRSSSAIEDQLEASFVLTQVMPEHALSHLRSLKIIFPPVIYDFSGRDHDIYTDWLETIDYISTRLKALSLHLKMEWGSMRVSYTVGDEESPDWQKELFLVHEQIVRPLQKLQSLKNISVQVMPFFDGSIESRIQRAEEHEKRLETLVRSKEDSIVMKGASAE